jgi:tRNA pseudouridine13 synthase
MQQIASALHVSSSEICHAGIKDKRALTYQRCSVNTRTCSAQLTPTQMIRRLMERLSCSALGNGGTGPLVSVGNFSFKSSPLQTGLLWGNRFSIRVRRVRCTDAEVTNQKILTIIEGRKTSLLHKGFLNIFGTQRTGQCPNTSSVLFQYSRSHSSPIDQYEELLLAAVRDHTAVGPRIGKLLVMREFKAAFDLILLSEEHTNDDVQDGCRKDDSGPIKAARCLYLAGAAIRDVISAFPQYCVRERTLLRGLQRYGLEAFESALLLLPHSSRAMYINAYQSVLWNAVAAHRARLGCTVQVGDLVMEQTGIESVCAVMPADLESGSYGIDQVVLPLFGSTVKYPSLVSANGRFYDRLLRQEGIVDVSSCVQPKGAYRKVIQRLEGLDIKMEGATIVDDSPPSPSHGTGNGVMMSLVFDLPAGSFATTLLSCLFHNERFL